MFYLVTMLPLIQMMKAYERKEEKIEGTTFAC